MGFVGFLSSIPAYKSHAFAYISIGPKMTDEKQGLERIVEIDRVARNGCHGVLLLGFVSWWGRSHM